MKHVLTHILEAVQQRRKVVLATVIKARGGTPTVGGAKIVVDENGILAGTVGGGKLEKAVLEDCKKILEIGGTATNHYSLTQGGRDALGMICGGEVEVFMEVYDQKPRIIIVGGGHVGRVLKLLADAIEYEVIVVDVEPGISTTSDLSGLILDQNSYVVLITSDYQSDEAVLRYAINHPVGYIGMIASRTKSNIILKKIREGGISEEQIEKIYTPIGVDLGGRSPQEVALSIISEIVAVRYKRSGGIISRHSKARTGKEG
jgi:xanthine dehydrogenase accessory factor